MIRQVPSKRLRLYHSSRLHCVISDHLNNVLRQPAAVGALFARL